MTKIPLSAYVEAIKQPRNNGGCDFNCRSRNTDLCSATTCSNYPPLPYCAEPDDRWPPQINACLREILRYRKQQINPVGYRRELCSRCGKGKAIVYDSGGDICQDCYNAEFK